MALAQVTPGIACRPCPLEPAWNVLLHPYRHGCSSTFHTKCVYFSCMCQPLANMCLFYSDAMARYTPARPRMRYRIVLDYCASKAVHLPAIVVRVVKVGPALTRATPSVLYVSREVPEMVLLRPEPLAMVKVRALWGAARTDSNETWPVRLCAPRRIIDCASMSNHKWLCKGTPC